ncbi:antitoxin VbhA family protein [Megamonas rupellensis]
MSDEYRKLSERYIKGEITLEELGNQVRKNL